MRSPGKTAQLRKALCCPPRDSPSPTLSHQNFWTVYTCVLLPFGKIWSEKQSETKNACKPHGKCKVMQAIPLSFVNLKMTVRWFYGGVKRNNELIWLHLLNVTLLLIRADKLGKENDNLALLVKEKMGRICSSTGGFFSKQDRAGHLWMIIWLGKKYIFLLS